MSVNSSESSDVDFKRTDAVGVIALPAVSEGDAPPPPSPAPQATRTTLLGPIAFGLALGGVAFGLAWLVGGPGAVAAALVAGLGTGTASGLIAWLQLGVRRRRELMREHDARLRQLLGSASGTCLWTWRQGRGRPFGPSAGGLGEEPSEAWFSESWTESFGLQAGTFDGPDTWFERIHPEDLGGLVHGLERVRSGDQPNLRRHYRIRHVGEWRWIEVHARAVDLADGRVLAGAVQDVTVHHSMQERLAHTAFHDALTGLPNRALFLDRLAHCTARARRNPRYRFAVVAPRGPLAYESPQLTVGWRLVARADLPWARDSSAAAEFRLLPRREGSLEDPYYFGPGYTALVAGIEPSPTVSLTPTGQPVRDRTPWWTLLLAILMMFALLYTLPALLVIAALCVGYALIRALLVRARLGSPELRVVPRVSCPEGVVEVTLAIEPRKDVQLAECFVELRAVLTVEKGQGKGRRTTTKALFERREQLALVGRQLRAGQRVEGAVAFAIPAEGPYTFIASSNKIRWIVAARAGISWWPAWREECELSVRPGQAPGAAYRRPSA